MSAIQRLANQNEPKGFLESALTWQGSVTPLVLPRVLLASAYALAVVHLSRHFPRFSIPITPFEYSGAVLGLLLVLRVNAGMDRWWEARKLWGSIVNQSRNLALIGYEYTPKKSERTSSFLKWVAAWPHVMRESLRSERELVDVERLLGAEATRDIREAGHMPTHLGSRLTKWLIELRADGLDDFSFQRAERERAILIDDIGACERIRSTPMPYALAVKTRRFLLLFLLLLPLALTERTEWLTPIIVALTAYPLFALDQIGAELQNPFDPRNLSHLPLTSICDTIERNVLELGPQA